MTHANFHASRVLAAAEAAREKLVAARQAKDADFAKLDLLMIYCQALISDDASDKMVTLDLADFGLLARYWPMRS